VSEFEGIPLPNPLVLKDSVVDVVSGDVDADGHEDRVTWETEGTGRRLVLYSGHTEADMQVSRILQMEDGPVDQAGDLLLLWRIGYPFPSLVTPGGYYLNEDGRLAGPSLPHEWVASAPVRLAGGDLNLDGFEDVVYFPTNNATWFAVALSNGGSGFNMPVRFLEPAGVRAVAVADINMDGHADIVVMGGSSLVLWSGN